MSFRNRKNEYIYLLREREFIRLGEETYKIGKTKQQNPFMRVHQYPKGSEVIMVLEVDDCDDTEKDLICMFTQNFERMLDYGREYFKGDKNKMMSMIFNFCSRCGPVDRNNHSTDATVETCDEYRPLTEDEIDNIYIEPEWYEPIEFDSTESDTNEADDDLSQNIEIISDDEHAKSSNSHPKNIKVNKKIMKRVCIKCGEETPILHMATYSKNGKIGYRKVCKICWNNKRKMARDVKKNVGKSEIEIELGLIRKNMYELGDDIYTFKILLNRLAKYGELWEIELSATDKNSIRVQTSFTPESALEAMRVYLADEVSHIREEDIKVVPYKKGCLIVIQANFEMTPDARKAFA